jgi:hypothetical protein
LANVDVSLRNASVISPLASGDITFFLIYNMRWLIIWGANPGLNLGRFFPWYQLNLLSQGVFYISTDTLFWVWLYVIFQGIFE